MPTAAVRVDHAVLAAALVLTALAFTSRAADPVNVIKLTALVLCAIAALASAAVQAVRTRVVQLPWGLPAATALALLLAFVVAAITAPMTTTAVLGTYGRNSGLLAYGSAVILFLVGVRVLDLAGVRVILYALAGTGLVLGAYGLFQYAGLDPVPWAKVFNPIIATLGNPNFAAAYLAICTPAAVWMALRSDLALPWRAVAVLSAALALVAAVLSNAFQGPLSAAAGLFVLALAWVLDRPAKSRRVGLGVLAATAVVGAAVLVAGVAGAGPVAAVVSSAGGRARVWYWDAALTMWRDQPLFGVGLDTYGGFYWAARPLEVVRVLGDGAFTNAAHSVPLHLLATGGALLGLTYVAFVGVVAVTLIRGLLKLTGRDRLLLGAVGGCWTAYQVQSWVSIDQVPLLTAQFVCAAGVIAAAGAAQLREVRLPGAPVRPGGQAGSRKGGRKRATPARRTRRQLATADYGLLALVGALALLAAFQALKPLRADMALLAGDRKLAAGNGSAALEAYNRAESWLPGSSMPLQRKASLFQKANRLDDAYASLKQGVDVNPYDLKLVRDAARFAENRGRVEEARDFYRRAVELKPEGGEILLEVATFELRHGGADRAAELLQRAVTLFPRRAPLWATLGDARAAQGDTQAALAAYQQALVIEPGQRTATAGVAKLGTTT